MYKYVKFYIAFVAVGVAINVIAQYKNMYREKNTIEGESHQFSRRKLLSFGVNRRDTSDDQCLFDTDCNHGECKLVKSRTNPNGTHMCDCDKGYVTHSDVMYCDYHQRKQVTAFLLSFFLGEFGADWFYIGDANPTYDGLGVLKLFTLGGLGVWWLADWIRIAASACNFKDPSGVCLESW